MKGQSNPCDGGRPRRAAPTGCPVVREQSVNMLYYRDFTRSGGGNLQFPCLSKYKKYCVDAGVGFWYIQITVQRVKRTQK